MKDPSKSFVTDIQELVPTHVSERLVVSIHDVSKLIKLQVSGRVVIDSKSHVRDQYMTAPRFFSNDITPVTPESLATTIGPHHRCQTLREVVKLSNESACMVNDELIMLCPARVRGYSLHQKLFILVLVERLCEIEWKPQHFEQLELKSEFKSILRAQVGNHYKSNKRDHDFIAQKGSGLIILLHGPPGCGKTLTAGTLSTPNLFQGPLSIADCTIRGYFGTYSTTAAPNQ